MRLPHRFLLWGAVLALTILLAADRIAKAWGAGWTYVWLARGKCPSVDETISGAVGHYAALGRGWALQCERVIDAVPFFGPGHCRAAARREAARKAATE